MSLYLFKLILILVFNIGINTYYINCSNCNCSCKSNKNNSGGGKHVDKFAIDLDNNEFKYNGKTFPGFKKIDNPVTNNVERVIHRNFMYGENIYYTIDEDIFNSIKKDSIVKITKNSYSDAYIVFAVKTRVKDFKEENQKYDYYLVYCDNCNNKGGYSLFYKIVTNVEIKILGNGGGLNNIGSMFYGDINLKNIVFRNCFNTSNVTNMNGMFKECKNLEELDLSTFDTNNVKNMYGMFAGCESLTKLNLSNFNTNNVTDMSYMFYGCSSLEKLNLSNFNTNNVKDMYCMFSGCSSLKELDLSNFNTSEGTNMSYIFFNCTALKAENLIGDKKIVDAFKASVKL